MGPQKQLCSPQLMSKCRKQVSKLNSVGIPTPPIEEQATYMAQSANLKSNSNLFIHTNFPVFAQLQLHVIGPIMP